MFTTGLEFNMDTLVDELANSLPKDYHVKLFCLESRPVYVKSIVTPHRSSRTPTVKIRHFFTLIDSTTNLVIFGIEFLVYINLGQQLDHYVFVSKCDTVGLHKLKVRIGTVVKCFLDYLVTYDLSKYNIIRRRRQEDEGHTAEESSRVNEYDVYQRDPLFSLTKLIGKFDEPSYYTTLPYYNKHPTTTESHRHLVELPLSQNVKIALFTRASDQYLFPKSHKNAHKHLVDGQLLLKWWLKVINGAVSSDWQCKVLIPGSEVSTTRKYIDPYPDHWSVGHIFDNQSDNIAVYNIPLFPDDPKGRFLEHLIVENRYSTVSIDQFYQELGFRQEFRLNSLVGLIGCKMKGAPVARGCRKPLGPSQNRAVVVSLADYKQILNVIKDVDYSQEIDVANLVTNSIPVAMEKFEAEYKYVEVLGRHLDTGSGPSTTAMAALSTVPATQPRVVNTLTVKRKPNNLNHLVKKRKRDA